MFFGLEGGVREEVGGGNARKAVKAGATPDSCF